MFLSLQDDRLRDCLLTDLPALISVRLRLPLNEGRIIPGQSLKAMLRDPGLREQILFRNEHNNTTWFPGRAVSTVAPPRGGEGRMASHLTALTRENREGHPNENILGSVDTYKYPLNSDAILNVKLLAFYTTDSYRSSKIIYLRRNIHLNITLLISKA